MQQKYDKINLIKIKREVSMRNRYETFTLLITKITRGIRKIKAEVVADFDLKVPHVSCIYYLNNVGPLTLKELCDKCEEDKSGVSRSIDFLEKKGYVVCDDDSKKRYKSLLRLTEKGKELGQIINERIEDVLNKASEGLTDAERVGLYKCLRIISDNLKGIVD